MNTNVFLYVRIFVLISGAIGCEKTGGDMGFPPFFVPDAPFTMETIDNLSIYR